MSDQLYQYEETRELVDLVKDAAELVRSKGEAAFDDFRVAGSRWRQEETYVFVLDPEGNMRVHPDPALEGRNALDPMACSWRPAGHEWFKPGHNTPALKQTFVRKVQFGQDTYIVGSGIYLEE